MAENIENYEKYKDFYKRNVITLPGDKRTQKLLDYVYKVNPNMTLKDFFELEDNLIMDDDL